VRPAIILPVVKDGAWHKAQPVSENMALPFVADGVSVAGVCGASIRMKSAKASMSDRTAVLGFDEKLSVSSWVALNATPREVDL
jgi:hypothetical protein